MSDAPATVFRAEQLGFAYAPGLPALDAVSFDLRAGEAVCLLGANGCGKSTLLRLLDGLLLPTAGTLSAFGRVLDAAALADDAWAGEFRRRVALLFQDADVQLFSSTALEDVAFGPLQLGLSPADARARAMDALALLKVERLAARSPSSLSGGEKRRVALAACLATDPDVLLVDEPFAALDPRSQAVLVDLLQALHERGRTIVMATHDLTIAEEVATRAIVLSEDHRVVADAEASAVLADDALLLRVNLIHEHLHRHGPVRHSHAHGHGRGHHHGHGDDHGQDHEHGHAHGR